MQYRPSMMWIKQIICTLHRNHLCGLYLKIALWAIPKIGVIFNNSDDITEINENVNEEGNIWVHETSFPLFVIEVPVPC
jgi:hypothetical protein